jgi:hypothetical protein
MLLKNAVTSFKNLLESQTSKTPEFKNSIIIYCLRFYFKLKEYDQAGNYSCNRKKPSDKVRLNDSARFSRLSVLDFKNAAAMDAYAKVMN